MRGIGGRAVGGLLGATTPMFGRADELAEVIAALEDPSVRLVTLTGRGGVGKTRLAVEVAHGLVAAGGPPTTMVDLSGVASVDLVMPEVAKALGIPPSSSDAPDDAVAARLANDDHVLVLDNLEHVTAVAARLLALLDRCAGLRVLTTSQAPLRLRCERVVRIEPLEVPPLVDVEGSDTIDESQPAVAIYLAAARSADAGFELRPDERPALVQMCRRLEGLPLAIDLAGARAASLRPHDIVRCLDEVGIGVLARPREDEPARHHDLGAAIAWTYDLLPRDQQRLLGVLSVGAGTFPVEAVLAAAGRPAVTVLDQLSALVDLHLVDRAPGPGSVGYSIAGSIRDHALARAEEAGELEGARRRYVVGWATLAHRAAAEVEADAPPTVLAPGSVGDGLLAALEVALEDGHVDDALDIVRVLADRWNTYGYHRAHEARAERCLAEAECAGADPIRWARVATWTALLGLRHSSTRSKDELLGRLRRAEAIGEEVGDDDTRLFALTVWVLVLPITHDVEEATRAATTGLELASRAENRRWLGAVRVWAGMLASQQGDVDRAVELGRAALDEARAAGDGGAIVRSTLLLAPLVRKRPDLLGDVPSNEEALALARAGRQPFYEAILEARLVAEAVAAGDGRRALVWAERTLLVARGMAGSPFVAFQLSVAALALAINDDRSTAARIEGVLRSVAPFLDAYDPTHGAARRALFDSVRSAMGNDAFESEAMRGAGMPFVDAVELALDAVREGLAMAEAASTGAGPEGGARAPTEEGDRLTERQGEVLRLLATGRSNKDIATALGISAKTVMHHTTAIYRTLGVRGRNEATSWAFRSGFLADHGHRDAAPDGPPGPDGDP